MRDITDIDHFIISTTGDLMYRKRSLARKDTKFFLSWLPYDNDLTELYQYPKEEPNTAFFRLFNMLKLSKGYNYHCVLPRLVDIMLPFKKQLLVTKSYFITVVIDEPCNYAYILSGSADNRNTHYIAELSSFPPLISEKKKPIVLIGG